MLYLVGETEQIKVNIQMADTLQQISREANTSWNEIQSSLFQSILLTRMLNPCTILIVTIEAPETALTTRKTPLGWVQARKMIVEQPDMNLIKHNTFFFIVACRTATRRNRTQPVRISVYHRYDRLCNLEGEKRCILNSYLPSVERSRWETDAERP